MSDKTGIEWTDATWNVIVGCDKVSAGCDNCYAIRTAHRMQANPNPKVSGAYAGTEEGMEWTGQVNLLANRLDQPLRWRKPRRIFVNAQSDLFHKDVPDAFIAHVWAIMTAAERHTFQILTKRPGRMRSLLSTTDFWRMVAYRVEDMGIDTDVSSLDPPRNVWLGVSVEDQKTADLRVTSLLGTPAAVRFLSCEPLLGPVDLSRLPFPRWSTDKPGDMVIDALGAKYGEPGLWQGKAVGIDWVIVGGESGPHARPMHPEWARSLRDQCQTAGVPFLFKQWGEWLPTHEGRHRLTFDGTLTAPHGGCVTSGEELIARVGKKNAGRLLDARTWDQFPATSEATA